MEKRLEVMLGVMDEHLGWIRRCLERLTEEGVWRRGREGTNAIGNLCLHLAGNESHYIGRGVGGMDYRRDRAGEFNARGGISRDGLLERLEAARAMTRAVFGKLAAADLDRAVAIDHPERATVWKVILHVVTHYAYHAGQIVLLTRLFQEGEERVLRWGH